MRKTVSRILITALLLTLLPQTAFAWQSERFWFQSEPVQWHMSRSASAGPVLSEGHHEHYQDRLTDLPDYALDFYGWLERNANADGALADPTVATAYGSDYYYPVVRISGSETFTFQTAAQRDATAATVAQAALDRELATFCAYASAMYSVFDREHPEVFWLSGGSRYGAQCGYTYSSRGTTCTVTYDLDMIFWLKCGSFDIRSENYRSAGAVAEGIDLRDAAIREILDGCTASDPYEQVLYLNRTLTQRNAYNRAVVEGRGRDVDPESWECISALTGRAGDEGPVCEGYARAFMVLCRELGIPCVLANGKAKTRADVSPEDHMWNLVCLRGSWYAADLTWNDPYVVRTPEAKDSGRETEEWLLMGSDTMGSKGMTFGQCHTEYNDIGGNGLCYTNGPVLSPQAYDPNAVPTYSIWGAVVSYGDRTAPVIPELLSEGKTQSLSLTGDAYTFENIVPGSYTLKVSKVNHVTRVYSLAVESDTVQNVKLHLLGDVTGDGKVNVADTSRIYSHVKGSGFLSDYAFACGDVDGNGKINVADTSKVYSHVKGSKLLW